MSAAPNVYDDQLEAQADEWAARMWRDADLSWKLDEHQRRVYDKYRAWEASGRPGGGMRRIFVMRIGRRWGKTFLVALIFLEDLLRNRGWTKTYATAFQKDIWEIVQPMIEELCSDAPEELRPTFNRTHMFYRFPSTGGVLKLVGIDKNPNGLRGRASDGFAVTEAGYVPKLARVIGNVVYPQFQRRDHASMILESSAPESQDHDFDSRFVPDARARDAFVEATIDDNTAISDEQRREFVEAARAIDPIAADREYYNIQRRNPSLMIVPEFDKARHVREPGEVPKYAHCYTAMDPGENDPMGLGWGFYDFLRAKLVIQRAAGMIRDVESELWGTKHREAPDSPKRQKHTAPMLTIADVVKTAGGLVWEPPDTALTYWSHADNEFKPNPYRRISDVAAQFVGDLARDHSINFEMTAKDDALAQLNALRHAFAMDWIEIWEPDGPLAVQLEYGMWRLDSQGKRVDWLRTGTLGHCDCIAWLIYLWRNLQRELNPFPPARIDTSLHGYALPVGVDKNTATGRPKAPETRFRQSPAIRRWR
jgi:hypothetical protein